MLGKSPDVIPPIAALSKPKPGARFARQFPHGCPREALMGRVFQHDLGPYGVGPCLIPYRRKARDPLAKGGFGRVERTGLDSVIEPLEAHIGLGRALVQFGDVLAAPLDALLPAIQQRGEHVFDPLGVQQPFLDVVDHHAVQFVHRDRAALAAGFALPRADRAGLHARCRQRIARSPHRNRRRMTEGRSR